jgi:hypothetical protein
VARRCAPRPVFHSHASHQPVPRRESDQNQTPHSRVNQSPPLTLRCRARHECLEWDGGAERLRARRVLWCSSRLAQPAGAVPWLAAAAIFERRAGMGLRGARRAYGVPSCSCHLGDGGRSLQPPRVHCDSSSRRRFLCPAAAALNAAKRSNGGRAAMEEGLGIVRDVSAWVAPSGYGGGPARRLGCGSGAARAWRRLCRAVTGAAGRDGAGGTRGGQRVARGRALRCGHGRRAAAWLWRPFGHDLRVASQLKTLSTAGGGEGAMGVVRPRRVRTERSLGGPPGRVGAADGILFLALRMACSRLLRGREGRLLCDSRRHAAAWVVGRSVGAGVSDPGRYDGGDGAAVAEQVEVFLRRGRAGRSSSAAFGNCRAPLGRRNRGLWRWLGWQGCLGCLGRGRALWGCDGRPPGGFQGRNGAFWGVLKCSILGR